jgi:inner membrane protein
MPSPVGHVLGGIAAGLLAGAQGPGPTASGSRDQRRFQQLALFGLLGAAPDVDLLFGTHSTYTHSIGAVAVVGIIAWLATGRRRPRFACAAAAAWGSHLLLDWLGADTTPPLGIMALWPVTADFYQSPVSVFQAISRRYWLPEFYWYNARGVLRELLILGPLVWLTARRASRALQRAT